jgi:hypothetical protein
MGKGAFYIVKRHPLVNAYRCLEFDGGGIRPLGKTTVPQRGVIVVSDCSMRSVIFHNGRDSTSFLPN